MWNWFNCYLSGRHEYGVWCEPGAIFLRCVHCGKRSPGWELAPKPRALTPTRAQAVSAPQATNVGAGRATRVLPFDRAAAR